MKANKKFIKEEDAVSAVIGVILMVAITVAIASTVYVYANNMTGGQTAETPRITFIKSEADNTLTVSMANRGDLHWRNIHLTYTTGAPAHIQLHGGDNDGGSGQDITVKDGWFMNPDGWGIVRAGQYLKFEDDAGPAGSTNSITISWIPTNTLLGSWEFINEG